MPRLGDLIAGHLHLMGGLINAREIFVFLSPQILSLALAEVIAGSRTYTELLMVTSSLESFSLVITYILLGIVVPGRLIRLSYSMRDTGMMEMFLNQGIRLDQVLLSLWIGSSLKYSLYVIAGSLIALFSSYLAGWMTAVEFLTALGVIAVIAALLSAICITLSLILPPSEAQYWSQGAYFLIFGYLYLGFLNPQNYNDIVRLFLSGYLNPKSLGGGAIAVFLVIVLLIELSEERGDIIEIDEAK